MADEKVDQQKESEKNSSKLIVAVQNVEPTKDNENPQLKLQLEKEKQQLQQQKTNAPKIISRMQIKDLKPTLQTCPLSNENRIKLKKESPFFVNMEEMCTPEKLLRFLSNENRMSLKKESPFFINMEEMCTPEKLLRLEMEKIPSKAPFKSEPQVNLRQIFKGYGNFKLVISPLWYNFKETTSFLNVNFQSFARTDLILKMIITNPKNFHVRPKIKELKPHQTGSFELHYCKETIQNTPYNMLIIGWMNKEKYQRYKKSKMDFFDFCVSDAGMGGFLVIPVTVEDSKEERNESSDKKEDHESKKSESKESQKVETKQSKLVNKIKATTPFESSCSRVTTTQESQKRN
uniref:Uncharacterized protein n=1 Tax=Panagrolaimus sp. ES5 TaxID=591445 RepID=A0AC34G8W3_9BILA